MNTKTTVSFSVLSGKGGVGKSNLALNLCYCLHQLGNTVLLMDSDMGLANIDVLLGISPDGDIQDIFLENKSPSDILVPIGPSGTEGFDLLPANSGMAAFADLEAEARNLLREKLNPLADRYDFFALDVGAGISPTALSFGAMTTVRVVVITPEPTSLTDSYALMKVLSATHDITNFHLLVNQVESHAEGKQTYNRLALVCERFLGFRPEYLGPVRSDRMVTESVRKQKPFSQVNPKSPASEDCMKIAEKLRDIRRSLLENRNMPEPLRDLAQRREPSAQE